MADKYDDAIAFLRTIPDKDFEDEIFKAWRYPDLVQIPHPAHCLFQAVSKSGTNFTEKDKGPSGRTIGCLTQIRNLPAHFEAETLSLTEEILLDERIPNKPNAITKDNLPVLAEWQRRLDKELRSSESV